MIKCSTQRVTCKFKNFTRGGRRGSRSAVLIKSNNPFSSYSVLLSQKKPFMICENEFNLHENEPVCADKFSKLGKLLSLIDGFCFLSPFEVFTNVYVIFMNRWAYGILLWEIFTIGTYIMSTFDSCYISTIRFVS